MTHVIHQKGTPTRERVCHPNDRGLTPANSEATMPTTVPKFANLSPREIAAQDEYFVVAYDKYPVSPGHCLIIARRPAIHFHDLTSDEKVRLIHWIDWTQQHLRETLHPAPDAFNLGLNDGTAAGQTISQFHFHVIPRYTGDVADPRGGIRYVIPNKACYWEKH